MEKIIVTTVGSLLIVFIWWFFFGKKENGNPAEVANKKMKTGEVELIVDGGYKPGVIFLQKDIKTKIRVIRKDPNTCLSDIIIPDFKISKYLPLNKVTFIEFTPDRAGEFEFHCGMNMFKGKMVIE